MTPSPTPLTFNFHPSAVTVISPYRLSMVQAGCAFSCAIVVIFFAVAAYRKLSAGGYSVSLNDISFGPIVFGLLVGYGVALAVHVAEALLALITFSFDAPWLWIAISCAFILGRVLAQAAAGAAVWLAAKENRLGHVMLAALATLVLDLSLSLFSTPSRYLSLYFFCLLFAKELLIPAIFIGARLAQIFSSPKTQPA